ncbi:MAG: rhomboid family intramembrane serine protease [Verrucomicrobiales bacterium]
MSENRQSEKRRGAGWVRLAGPGWHFPTLGAAVMVLVFAGIALTGGVVDETGRVRDFYGLLGLNWEGLRAGRWWQPLTHAWLHASWGHVLLNAGLFYYGASRLDHILGRGRSWRVFSAGVLAGAAAQVLVQAWRPEMSQDPLVGASGGVMALLLALVTLSPESRMLLLPVSGKNLGRGFLLAAFLLFIMTPQLGVPVFGAFGRLLVRVGLGEIFAIGHLYHLAGGLAGCWWAARLFGKPVSLAQLQEERRRREELASGTRSVE